MYVSLLPPLPSVLHEELEEDLEFSCSCSCSCSCLFACSCACAICHVSFAKIMYHVSCIKYHVSCSCVMRRSFRLSIKYEASCVLGEGSTSPTLASVTTASGDGKEIMGKCCIEKPKCHCCWSST